MKKIVLALLVIAVAGLGFYYWYQNQKPLPVSITMVQSGAEGILAYAIEKLELDRQYGLDISIRYVEPGENERLFIEGAIDVGSNGPLELVNTLKQDVDAYIFAPQMTALHSLLVKSDSKYNSLADLKGKKLAVLPKASSGYKSMYLELKILGIDLEKDNVLAFGAIPDLVGFLGKGEVDGAFIPEPAASNLIASGKYKEVLNLAEIWQKEYGTTYFFNGRVARKSWLDANLTATKRFLKMHQAAINYVKENPEFVAEYVREKMNVKDEKAMDLIVERLPKVFSAQWDDNTIKNAMFVMEKGVEFKIIDKIPENFSEHFVIF